MSIFLNIDCMDALPWFPDNHFDLAIVDPPYGDGNGGGSDRPIRIMGGEVRQKNHRVGHKPRRGIFQRTIPCLTQTNRLGRKLFQPSADKKLHRVAEKQYTREIHYGDV